MSESKAGFVATDAGRAVAFRRLMIKGGFTAPTSAANLITAQAERKAWVIAGTLPGGATIGAAQFNRELLAIAGGWLFEGEARSVDPTA